MENNPFELKQVAIRMVEMPPLLSKEPMDGPQAAVRVMADTFRDLDREVFCIVNLRTDLKPINMNIISMGTLNSSLAHPREVLKSSILSNAASIMLFHNHPTGNLTPSREDIELTDRMQQICTLIGIPVMDHIILGTGNQYYSFKEKDILTIPKLNVAHNIDQFRLEGSKVAESTRSFDPKQAAENRRQELKDITEKLEKGVSEIFTSEKYQELLNTMAKFPRYSLNNNLLIMLQKPDATLCQSYTGWNKMGRFVKRGEKGIRILAPAPFKMEREQNKLDDKGRAVLDQDGEPVKEKTEISVNAFKPVSTFDISQTDGEPLPEIGVSELAGEVKDYQTFFDAVCKASLVPVAFENIQSGAKGYFHTEENRIAIKEGMSEIQNVKTAIHEMAHAKLHNLEAQQMKEGKQSRNSKEVEAESVAYTVCQHYGIDTSDYSFAYVATWSQGKEMPELKESLNTIRQAASELITSIDEKVQELTAEREPAAIDQKTSEALKAEAEKPYITFSVAECSEFPSMGEFHENLTLPEAVEIYKQIPAERMHGIKSIRFEIQDKNEFSSPMDLVRGDRLQLQEVKELAPALSYHPLVQKAFEDVQQLMGDILKDRVTIDPPFKVEQLKDEPIKVVDAREKPEKEQTIRLEDITDIKCFSAEYYPASGQKEYKLSCEIKGVPKTMEYLVQRKDDGEGFTLRTEPVDIWDAMSVKDLRALEEVVSREVNVYQWTKSIDEAKNLIELKDVGYGLTETENLGMTKDQIRGLFDKISEKEKSLKQSRKKTSVKENLKEKKKETATQRKKPVKNKGEVTI